MKLHTFTPVFAALALAIAAPASAQVHRCVDAQGKVSFSDTLCEGIRAQKVFSAGSSAKAWLGEGYRPQERDAGLQRVAQTATVGLPGRTAVSTPPR